MDNLNEKIANATKWSAFAELGAKIVLPIVNMILARILTPQAFGIVATITVVISFAEIFQDAGFQKYIIQHEFISEESYNKSATVAFWTNLFISIILWMLIVIFRDNIAILIGEPQLGFEVVIAGISLPIFSFSSIQISHYRRNFAYKKLFQVRIITAFIPLLITVPLALIFKNHWALIIGTIARNGIQTLVLYQGTAWKPKLFYSFKILREMLSFCMWTLLESISIWLTSNVSIFIVSKFLGTEIVGFYKTSIATVTSITGIVSAVTLNVLFSALSRLQNDEERLKRIFYDYQKIVAIFIIPMGAGIWLYSELFVKILLGDKWLSCADFIGIYAFVTSIAIVTNSFFSELYRAKGKPKISMLAQVLYLMLLIPSIIIASQHGFYVVAITTAMTMICFSIIHFIISKIYFKLNVTLMIGNLLAIIAVTGIMASLSLLLKGISHNIIWQIISIFICMFAYLLLIIVIPPFRNALKTSELTAKTYVKIINIIRKGCRK